MRNERSYRQSKNECEFIDKSEFHSNVHAVACNWWWTKKLQIEKKCAIFFFLPAHVFWLESRAAFLRFDCIASNEREKENEREKISEATRGEKSQDTISNCSRSNCKTRPLKQLACTANTRILLSKQYHQNVVYLCKCQKNSSILIIRELCTLKPVNFVARKVDSELIKISIVYIFRLLRNFLCILSMIIERWDINIGKPSQQLRFATDCMRARDMSTKTRIKLRTRTRPSRGANRPPRSADPRSW